MKEVFSLIFYTFINKMKTIQLTSLKFYQMFNVRSMLMINEYTAFRLTVENSINHILGWVVQDHFEDTLMIS